MAISGSVGFGATGAPDVSHVRSILVVRLGALGDVVRTRFAFSGLRERFPTARIDWLVEDRAAAGLERIVGLDDIVRVPRGQMAGEGPVARLSSSIEVARELRRRRYDLVVDFHSILKSALFARASGAPLCVGYAAPLARENSAVLFTHRLALPSAHVSRFRRNAALVEFLGGQVSDEPPPLAAAAPLAPELDDVPAGLVVIHPGTSESTRYKRWDASRFAHVARQLHDELGLRALVTWGPVDGERRAAEAVVEGAGGAARMAPATGGVSDLLALLARARLFIGSDSGPMHLASLAGLPVLALFGPTDPIENAPFSGTPSRVVRVDVGCNPCRAGCPARSCMAAIPATLVVDAARELVAATGGVA